MVGHKVYVVVTTSVCTKLQVVYIIQIAVASLMLMTAHSKCKLECPCSRRPSKPRAYCTAAAAVCNSYRLGEGSLPVDQPALQQCKIIW